MPRNQAEAVPSWNADSSAYEEGGDNRRSSSIASDSSALLPMLDLAALARTNAKPTQFVIERIAPKGEVTLLYGAGSAGKSLLAQQFATACAAGLPCLGLNIEPGTAIYVTCEDSPDALHWRQEHICRSLGVSMEGLAGKLCLSSLKGNIGNELATFGTDGGMALTPAFHRLRMTLERHTPKLAILDNVAHLFAGNENARPDVTRFVNALNRLADRTGAAIILLGHPNKAGDEWSGSTAWNNVVRSRLWLQHDEMTDVRSLTLPKANNSPKGDVVSFRWHEWAFVRDEDLGSNAAKELANSVMAGADNRLFLACLQERTKQQRAVSEKRGPTFAPTEFAKMAESKGIGKRRLEAAMDRLFRIEAIERAELWKGPDRKPVYGLRETAGNGAGDTMRATRETAQ